MKFSEIEKFPLSTYSVHVSWDYLEDWIGRDRGDLYLDMNPEYQRDHVWTEEQQIAYIEYKLKGGPRDLLI